jgi:hypothetical protein
MTEWRSLRHAYGSAADVPALLDRLTPRAEAGVWGELWSRICHQGTVYSASFAALPALAAAAERWSPTERVQALVLAGSILSSDDVDGGDRVKFLRPIEGVVPHFQKLCAESLAGPGLPETDFIHLLQAARSFEGDHFWGRELERLADGEFTGTCPHCGAELFLVMGEYGFFATSEEWVRPAGTRPGRTAVRPGSNRTPIEPNAGELPDAGGWLHERARAAQQHDVARLIRHVFGTTACPLCGDGFEVRDAISEQ